MEAGAAPVAELLGAGAGGREAVSAPREASDALQRVGRQLLLRRQLALVRDVLHRAAAAAIDDRARGIDATATSLQDAQRPGPLEPALSGQLRLDHVARSCTAQEDDAAFVSRQRLAAVHHSLGRQGDPHAGGRARSLGSLPTNLPTNAPVSTPTSRSSMPIPRSSTPAPLA